MPDRVAAADSARQHIYYHKKDFVCQGTCRQLRRASLTRMGIPALSVFNPERGQFDHFCGDRLVDFRTHVRACLFTCQHACARAHTHA